MKKLLLILLLGLVASTTFGQKKALNRDSILVEIRDALEDIKYLESTKDKYKMYPTENIYTFLRLNTSTGQIDQVQWSLDDEKEGYVTINAIDLSYGVPGLHFELYPTQNMYQFILLEKSLGLMYHVQWGMGDEKRWIRPIL